MPRKWLVGRSVPHGVRTVSVPTDIALREVYEGKTPQIIWTGVQRGMGGEVVAGGRTETAHANPSQNWMLHARHLMPIQIQITLIFVEATCKNTNISAIHHSPTLHLWNGRNKVDIPKTIPQNAKHLNFSPPSQYLPPTSIVSNFDQKGVLHQIHSTETLERTRRISKTSPTCATVLHMCRIPKLLAN